jgi:hypothetical protein
MDGFPPRCSRKLFPPVLTFLLAAACGSAGDTDGATLSSDATGGGLAVQEATGPRGGLAWVIFGADTVVAEVARTAAERQEGLMDRDEVPEGTGMLFVFDDEATRSFWMKDTQVPLDIAYINADLRIVDIFQMEPLVTTTYDSSAPAMFALEVRQGWFAEQGIGAGAQAQVVFGH